MAVGRHEEEWVEKASHPRPPGFTLWGKTLRLAGRYLGTLVNITMDETHFPLQPFGVSGRIIFTPGHTPGSSRVLLETGDAFVGDLVMNGFPLLLGPGVSSFGNSVETVRRSWRLLLGQGAMTVYPGHGQPFGAEVPGEVVRQ